MKLRLAILTTCLSLSACGIDDTGKPRRPENDELNLASAECRKVVQNGCVQGQVIAAPDIYVNGSKFFDADELAQKFKSMLDVQSLEKDKIKVEDFDLTWLTKLDNKSFVREFQVYLKGAIARQGDVYGNGSFALNYLPEGSYDLRVQKVFKFELSAKSKVETTDAVPAAADAEKPEGENVTEADPVKTVDVAAAKTYCVIFYAILPVEIRKDYKTTGIVFDQFDFEVKSCETLDKDQPITL